jgi:hypothetical protein
MPLETTTTSSTQPFLFYYDRQISIVIHEVGMAVFNIVAIDAAAANLQNQQQQQQQISRSRCCCVSMDVGATTGLSFSKSGRLYWVQTFFRY